MQAFTVETPNRFRLYIALHPDSVIGDFHFLVLVV
jgi:hypothetical protein